MVLAIPPVTTDTTPNTVDSTGVTGLGIKEMTSCVAERTAAPYLIDLKIIFVKVGSAPLFIFDMSKKQK